MDKQKDLLRSQSHLSDEDFNIAYDLGMHAARETMRTIIRIAETAPKSSLKLLATQIAHAWVEWHLEVIDEQMDTVSPGYKQRVTAMREIIAEANKEPFEEYAAAAIGVVSGKLKELRTDGNA
jgi:hypothetical protein